MHDSGANPFLIAVVLASMGIQLAAAAQALRLIRLTHHHLAWILIALTCCVQAVRRGFTLTGLLLQGNRYPVTTEDQFLGLMISIGMLAGVTFIGPIFQAHHQTERALRAAIQENNRVIEELQTAMERISLLSGMLPICSYCKRIRNDQGYWEQVESYIRGHSAADFSHGICPDCLEKAMREMDENGYGADGGSIVEATDGETDRSSQG